MSRANRAHRGSGVGSQGLVAEDHVDGQQCRVPRVSESSVGLDGEKTSLMRRRTSQPLGQSLQEVSARHSMPCQHLLQTGFGFNQQDQVGAFRL